MRFLLAAGVGAAVLLGMRRIMLLRYVGQRPAALRLYRRWSLGLGLLAWLAMGGQMTLLLMSGMFGIHTALPLHLCSLMGVMMYPALRLGSRGLWEAVLFLAVPGGLGALLFPAVLNCNYPRLMQLFFNLLHCTLIVAPWLPLSLGLRPRPSGAARPFGLLSALACVALAVNTLAGTNYLFLRSPVAGTPLALLGHWGWGWYVAALAVLACVLLGAEAAIAAWAEDRWPERFPLRMRPLRHLG